MPPFYHNSHDNTLYDAMPSEMHIMAKLLNSYKELGLDLFPVWITGKGKNVKGSEPKSPHRSVYRYIVGEGNPGSYYGDESREDLEVFQLAEQALREAVTHDNFLCFVHFKNPDRVGHQTNDYDTYMEKAQKVDQYIYDLMQNLPSDTTLIYCSDHGFNFKSLGDKENGHSYSPRGMLAVNFLTVDLPCVEQSSIGRLIYRLAGGNPDDTYYRDESGKKKRYHMYGLDLI